jgi:hypothetical protein
MRPAEHTTAQAAHLILPSNHGLTNPEKWIRRQLLAGRFTGQRIGRTWFMNDADIAAARAALRQPRRPEPKPEPEPAQDIPVTVVDGLSARGRRRLLGKGA